MNFKKENKMNNFLRCKDCEGTIVYLNIDRIDILRAEKSPMDGSACYVASCDCGTYQFYVDILEPTLKFIIGGNLEKNNKEDNHKPVLQKTVTELSCEDPFQND